MAKEFTLEQALSAPANVKEFGLDAALGKAPTVERPDLGSPMGDDFGASIMAAAGTQPRQEPAAALPTQGNPNSISAQDYMAAVAKRKEENPDRSVSDVVVDSGITLLKGAIGLPESFVGLADIPTAGYIGKFLEGQGYKPKEAKAILDSYLSEAQQAANRKVSEAKGFTGTLGAALQNPSVIATSAAESLPQMLGGAGIARGLMKAAPALAPWLAGAAGEGLLGAGSAAEQMRQDEKSGLLSAKQALSAVGSGAGTAAFGAVGGRLANKLGLDDIETMLATGNLGGKSKSVADFAKKAGASGISEGVFEEMPQSAQEQMWMNYAADKPIMEGVAEASAMGLVTGAAMGIAGTGASQIRRKKEEEIPSAEQMARDRGFLVSGPKAKPAGDGMEELIKLASEEPVKPDQLTPSEESRKKRLAEQQMVTDLEKEAEGTIPQEAVTPEPAPAEQPAAEQPAPAAEQEVAVEPPAEPQAGKPTAAELRRNQEFATEYDTPEQNLREGETFGQDLMSLVNEEKESYGRAALKNRKLTQKYADMSDSWTAAGDAAKIAFAENNYEVFRPYEEYFKKTAKALQAAIEKNISLAKADAEALVEMEKRPSAAEEMSGAPVPMLPEVEEQVGKLTKDQEAAIAEREKLEKRTAGTSLMQVLKGTLNDNELSELGGRARKVGKNQFLNLKASKGQAGSSMEDMVDSGKLDIFLPEKMRPEHPDYVNSESAEYIRDKLRNNQFYTYDTELAIKRINQDIESLERQIQDLLSDDEINKELQYAANEQRELDQATEKPAAKGTDGAAEQRETKAADDELAKRKAKLDAEEELNEREAKLLEERKRLNEERLKLESPTKEDVADQEERKAKAAELDEREQIRKESEAGAGQFELKGEDGRQDTTGGLFDQPEAKQEPEPAPEPAPIEISTKEERKAALKLFKSKLLTTIQPFRSRGGDNKVSVIKPTALKLPLMSEILKIASVALDLGLPPAVLGNVTAAGSTRNKAIAMMSNTGWLMIGSQWKNTSEAEKLLGIIHELGHAVDNNGGLISEKASWDKAHDELKEWYRASADKFRHPLAYPFASQYKGKVRIRMESFAQAFGYYFTSPVDLQKNAPEAYSQIQSIVERIQNESNAARAAGTTKTGTAGIKVQPARTAKGAAAQPATREVSPAVGAAQGLEDRGAGEVSGADAFNPEEIEKLRIPNYKGRERIIEMRIEDFLNLADDYTNDDAFNRNKKETAERLLREGKPYNTLPFLTVERDGQVSGHEGRHRAQALKDAGYTTIPVVIKSANIRWDQQDSPDRFDYVENWPEKMKAQEGARNPRFSIPFPVSRKDADAPYGKSVDVNAAQAASQTETPAFKRWFGDSKVVDADGKPLVVYHGSINKGVTEFDTTRITTRSAKGDVAGTYFTADKMAAGNYTRPFGATIRTPRGEVVPAYLSIKNPLNTTAAIKKYRKQGMTFGDAKRKALEALTPENDGIIFDGDGVNPSEYVVFKPTQIKSATGNNGQFDPEVVDINMMESVTAEEKKRNPSLKRTLDRLNREREAGKIGDERFINEVDWALKQAENARMKTVRGERVRGADFIRQKLLEAKRRGELSEEAVDFAEWFIQNNPQLVDDLGIGIKTPKEGGVGGQYVPFSRIMVLMKNAGNDETIVHEVLHHLERMMPEKVQTAIRSAWSAQLSKAAGKAKTENDKKFFKLLTDYHFAGDRQRLMEEAIQMIKDGKVSYENYQYVNPSEFWAVNGADITKGRFDAVRGGVLARLKNWLKELGTKMAAVFGVKNNAPIIKALDSLAKADGKFVSKKMLSEASQYASVGQNIFDQRPLVAWGTPTESKMDDAIYYLQNKQIDMKRVVDEIQKSIGAIDDRWNPYLMEELFHGRSAKQTRDFMKNELRPLLQEMDRMGVTTDELEEYLHNVHAEERNEQIAKVNPSMPDGGSGIDTADAQAYLASLTPEQESKYSDLARMVAIITKGTRQMMVDSGLESQETIDQWEETYGNYIPLNREDVEYSSNHGMSAGQGYSVRGPASRRATGSTKQVVDILANIAMQRERTIVRAEKNRVATALYGLAVKNPNPKFWLAVNPDSKKDIGAVQNELVDMGMTLQDAEGLMKEPTQKIVDPKTGLVTERVNPVLRGADNVLAVRVNGKDRYVFFNQNDDRAKRMATALKGLDADQLGRIMTMSARFTRYFASMSTQYNPIFGVVNLTRDLQGAMLQMSDTEIAGKRKAVMKNIMPAIAGIYKDLRAERDGKVGKGEWSRLWDEFQQEGGQTGFRDQFSRSDERARALEVELNKLSEGKPMRSARAVFDWLSDYNETLENGVRLAAYKVALDQGLSKEKAASIAKNLTVNFNRKGQIATQANALYAFFNSAVQGTTRLVQTMAGPAGKTIFYGGALLGIMQASMLAFAGFGDDEPPEFIKNKNFIIPLMNGKYISIPMPLGYNVIPSMFRIATEGGIDLLKGKPVNAGKRVTDIAGLLMDAFNPIGNAGFSFQTLAPTVADPIVALFENKDWTGKPIAKKDFNSLRPTPGYTRAKEAASSVGKWTAEMLNKASGGTEFTPGLVSPTPDQIDYLIGQATGGVGRELLKVNRTARSTVTGEELAPHNIPLVGRFYGDTQGSSSVANKFYANLLKLNLHQNEIEGRAETKGDVQGYLKENPEARLYKAADEVERNVQKLRKIRRDLVEKDAPKERVKAIEANITTQMKNLNTLIEKAEAKRKE